MMLVCPKCRAKILATNVNVSTDLAKCENCQHILKASALIQEAECSSDLAPPVGSRIRVESSGQGEVCLHLPAAGVSWTLIFPLVFCVFWLAFMSFWTWGASRGSIAFALFSIPFWCVGIAMIVGLMNSICERQEIRLRQEGLRIARRRPCFPRVTEIPLEHISKIAIDKLAIRDPLTMARHLRRFPLGSWVGIPQAVITHGTRMTTVGEYLSEPEQEWVATTLRALVVQFMGPYRASN